MPLHLGAFSRHVTAEIDRRIAELDAAAPMLPPAVQREPMAATA